MGWRALAAGCVIFAAGGSAGAGGLQVSAVDPYRFAFNGDNDLLYVLPGNQGESWLRAEPAGDPGNLEPWQDVYCDSRWLGLDSESYDFHAADGVTSAGQEYWQRLERFVSSCTFSGDVPFWAVGDGFVKAWAAEPEIMDELTSQVPIYGQRDLLDPAFVFKGDGWGEENEEFVRQLRGGLPFVTVGVYVSEANAEDVPARGWDFIVCEEEVIPEMYRGQAAAAWLRDRFGAVPVMVSPARPEFQRDMVWLSTGVAGIWYRPLPKPGTVENRQAAAHLRATSVYLNRFGNDVMHLQAAPGHPGLNFSMEASGRGWSGIIAGGTTEPLMLQVPAEMQDSTVGTNWYNPATDENIIAPLTTIDSGTISVKPPNSSLWAYSLVMSGSAPDTGTTVSAIRELDY